MDWEQAASRINHDESRLFEQIADDIAAAIAAGQLQSGERLPNEYDLAEAYHVARVTVRRAMQELRERRLVRVLHGRGTFVASSDVPAEGSE